MARDLHGHNVCAEISPKALSRLNFQVKQSGKFGLMGDLRSARDYLKQEAERIQQETAQLRNLSKSALASVHLISGNLSKWRGGDQKAA
jgi:hypothetical protein